VNPGDFSGCVSHDRNIAPPDPGVKKTVTPTSLYAVYTVRAKFPHRKRVPSGKAMSITGRVANRFAASLRLGPASVDDKGTESLRKIKKLPAKNRGDIQSAIMSAGYHAQKMGRDMYVFLGNSFGSSVWRVSYKPSEYLNKINNTGSDIAVVTPELELRWHALEGHTT